MRNKTNENEGQQPQSDFENLIDFLDSESGATISGRVYRITSPIEQASGKLATELICKVDEPIDDDWIGVNFGPGRYRVRYRIKAAGASCGEDRTFIYNVGPEYEKYKKTSNPEPPRTPEAAANAQTVRGGFLENFLSGLTPEKITAFGLGIKALKELFAPPPQPDYSKLFEILATQNKPAQSAPALSDTIVLSAMESLKQHNKQPTIFEQLRDLKRLKEELKEDIKDEENDNDSGENMNFLLKTALEYLPALLKQNNNNFQAVGAQAGENPFVKNLVSNDPELAQVFFEKAREKYGLENAKKLALGFGYNLDLNVNAEGNENLKEDCCND